MSVHDTRAAALLAWVNSLKLEEALNSLSPLQDCRVFIKIIDKIHGTEEGRAVLQQSLPERVAYVSSFLEKCCKHQSTSHSLVSEEKLLAGDELELAKVVMLLLYQASMSEKIPREWSTVDYDIQAEMAKFLNFMLYNEECLGENLESFLQKKTLHSASFSGSSTSSEETTPQKQEVHFLKLQKIASSSSLSRYLPGSSASPMGDIMQTPQFQMRRLKKQLEAERENRDDLEREVAENRKLIDEKDTQILVMKQRIDHLSRLQKSQAADQVEPKEMEELRERNESLLMRLHEILKQCQDLKTEKGQMDRKINQLLEENGDLSFKLRELASNLMGLQEAMNELSTEHNTALRDWEERRTVLESNLHQALGEKKCLEEKLEILQGKISLLEDQLAKLKESSSSPGTGEVMGNVLQLEDLKQQVASLLGQQVELQATVARVEEEKRLLEATLQTDRGNFEEEKLQLTGLLSSMQNSTSELSQAKQKLEQDSQAEAERLTAQVNTLTTEIAKLTGFLCQKDQELLAWHQQAEAEKSQNSRRVEELQQKEQAARAAMQELSLQVDQLNSSLKQSKEALGRVEAAGQEERRRADQELGLARRRLEEAEAERSSLASRLQALEGARDASAIEAQREKSELGQKVRELEARIVALGAQCQQSEAQAGMVPALKGQLREAQQRLAEREKLSKENARLQERLLVLEESVRNTEGILEDEKRRAAESLEGNLRRIADLEEQLQELTKHHDQAQREMSGEKARRLGELPSGAGGRQGQLEERLQALEQDREQAGQQLQAEREKAAAAEAQLKQLKSKYQEAQATLQAQASRALAQAQERESAEETLRAEVASWREKLAAAAQEAGQSLARAKEEEERKAALALEGLAKELAAEREGRAALEARLQQLRERSHKDLAAAEGSLSSARSAVKEREQEVEQLASQVKSLKGKLEEAAVQQRRELATRDGEAQRLAGEQERTRAELAAEKAGRAALEVQLQNVTNELRVEVSGLQEEVARAQAAAEEKERELDELRVKNVSRDEELRDLQKTVQKLKSELASLEALKERAAKAEGELQGFLEGARAREAELDGIRATLGAKDLLLQKLEGEKRRQEQEAAAGRELCDKKQKECEALRGRLERLEHQSEEQSGAVAKLEQAAASSEQRQAAEVEALRREVAQHKERSAELEKLLAAARSVQASSTEKLKRELLEKGKELAQSREAAAGAEKELAALQEKGKAEESWKEQMSRCLQDAERKNSLLGSLEKELSLTRRQLLEKEVESKEMRRLAVAESEKSKKLEERLRLLQSEMATAASRAAERCSAMKAEAQDSQKQAEELRGSLEAQKKELGALAKREEDLRKELRPAQEKAFQKEQALLAVQQELAGAQATLGELMPVKRLYQQLQAEQAAQKSQHQEERERLLRESRALQAELARARQELGELLPLREGLSEQERRLQQLQAEKASYTQNLAALQQAHAKLAGENQALVEEASRGQQRLDTELAQARQQHAQQLEDARREAEKRVAVCKQEAEEARRKLEGETAQSEEARQKLLVQVEQLERCQKEMAKQAEELKQKLSQQDKAGRAQQQKAKVREQELQKELDRQNEKMADLQEQLTEKEQAAEHYKGQMEKAKTHYDAKKQQNQELLQKLKGLEQLEKENAELKAESERLAQELQRTALQAKESELSCKSLTSRVHSLEAQVEFADRQLRNKGKLQVATETLKHREGSRQDSADISTDSLEWSTSEEAPPINSTRKTRRSLSESGTAEPLKAAHQLPRKVESLESLYFTPIPTRARSKLGTSIDSMGDVSFESGRKSLSSRRRTTQKDPEPETPPSAGASFFSVPSSEGSQASAPSQESVKTRLRSAATSSTRSLASLPSQESLARLSASSPDDAAAHAALMSLPGYRPTTRSSLRRSGVAGASAGGRSSLYLGTCQDEPDHLDEWNRIAELQQRNRVCPPHLKTCYPLESRPSQSLTAITDEEMKTGDPKETLRRASMLPSQIAEGPMTRRSTLSSAWVAGGVATRHQRKRTSTEALQGLGTPESKKSASCFPRPQTPKRRNEELKRSSLAGGKKGAAQDKQTDRRQSLAFSILNTPKKLGNSLLRRGANRKVTPKNSPRGGSRRSPRAAASPKGKASSKSHRNSRF
ncbi:nuclear mitotic apparatus protein 1 isoform X2 [Paroedura picta]|uniref:nuclear mitotic apparatus protein 1 isoform X2 n=1 Tax=Paroedura picta TaxID=143630 RepID=UPI004056E1D4